MPSFYIAKAFGATFLGHDMMIRIGGKEGGYIVNLRINLGVVWTSPLSVYAQQ